MNRYREDSSSSDNDEDQTTLDSETVGLIEQPPKSSVLPVAGDSLDWDSLRSVVSRSSRSLLFFCIAILLSIFILLVPILPTYDMQKCAALFAFCITLWISEAIPFWVTGLFIPLLVVVGDLAVTDCLFRKQPMLANSGHSTMSPTPFVDQLSSLKVHSTARRVLWNMADPHIYLIMGGFALGSALHKHGVDKAMARAVLMLAGNHPWPSSFLLAVMMFTFVLSCCISNIASSVITFFLFKPLLMEIPNRSYRCSIVMGIAYAANIGGMATPVSSPQNAFALAVMERNNQGIGFFEWIVFSLPICIVVMLVTWRLLLIYFKPENLNERLPLFESVSLPIVWNLERIYVAVVAIVTIAMLCSISFCRELLGTSGMLGLIPMILLFAPGILTKNDLSSIDWSVLFLMGGGITIGDALEASGLLDNVALSIAEHLTLHAFWIHFAVFCTFVPLVGAVVSHLVAALCLLPVIERVGHVVQRAPLFPTLASASANITGNHSRALVLGSVIALSGASLLPISSLPNLIAYTFIDDSTGKPYLTTTDFLKVGFLVQATTCLCLISIGYVEVLFLGL